LQCYAAPASADAGTTIKTSRGHSLPHILHQVGGHMGKPLVWVFLMLIIIVGLRIEILNQYIKGRLNEIERKLDAISKE
jgi:hypothetical protein